VPTRWATPNDIDTVFSIDVATGKVVWKHSYPCNEKVGIKDYDGPFATPTVANGVVYTLSRKGMCSRWMRAMAK
jgi:outer membrane protein assembly factor BamB